MTTYWLTPLKELEPAMGCRRTGRVVWGAQNMPVTEWVCPDAPRLGMGDVSAPTDEELSTFRAARLPQDVWWEVFGLLDNEDAVAYLRSRGMEPTLVNAIKLWREGESARAGQQAGVASRAELTARQAAAPGLGVKGWLGTVLIAGGVGAALVGGVWWLLYGRETEAEPMENPEAPRWVGQDVFEDVYFSGLKDGEPLTEQQILRRVRGAQPMAEAGDVSLSLVRLRTHGLATRTADWRWVRGPHRWYE